MTEEQRAFAIFMCVVGMVFAAGLIIRAFIDGDEDDVS